MKFDPTTSSTKKSSVRQRRKKKVNAKEKSITTEEKKIHHQKDSKMNMFYWILPLFAIFFGLHWARNFSKNQYRANPFSGDVLEWREIRQQWRERQMFGKGEISIEARKEIINNFDYKVEQQMGIECNKIEAATFVYTSQDGDELTINGFKATDNIHKGDTVLSIPKRSLLTEDKIWDNTDFQSSGILTDPVFLDDLSPFTRLVLFLIHEANDPDSYFRYYIDRLYLSDLHTFPVFNIPVWGNDYNYSNTIEDTKLLQLAMSEYHEAKLSLNKVILPLINRYPLLFNEKDVQIDAKLFLWASKCITSRYWDQPISNIHGQDVFVGLAHKAVDYDAIVLIPYGDIFNFGYNGILQRYNEKSEAVEFYHNDDDHSIKKGEEVLFYYGTHCVHDWYMIYGFAPDDAEDCIYRGEKNIM